MVLSSGDVVPFELHIERDGAPALWRVTALADGDLRVERAQGRSRLGAGRADQAAPEDDQNEERVSNARR